VRSDRPNVSRKSVKQYIMCWSIAMHCTTAAILSVLSVVHSALVSMMLRFAFALMKNLHVPPDSRV